MELSEVYEALETLREFCLGKKSCKDCELRKSPFCKDKKSKLKELTFNNPDTPPAFRFFN